MDARIEELITSEEIRNKQQQLALKVFLGLTLMIMFPSSLIDFFWFEKNQIASVELLFGVIGVLSLLYVQYTRRLTRMMTAFFVFLVGAATLIILLWMHTDMSTLMWVGIFPFTAFYLLGTRMGILAYILFSMILFGALLFDWHNGTYVVDAQVLVNVTGTLLAFGLFAYLYEYTKDQALQQVFLHSYSDELTGAGNRKMFTLLLQKEKAASQRHLRPLALIMVDIDHFKNINDRFGHIKGDQILRQFTALLKSNLRRSDLLFRWGGEEFIILLPDETSERAHTLAEKLRVMIEHNAFGLPIKMTASFGITEVLPGETDEATIHRLDNALYRAKESGRNRVVVFH